MQPTGKIGIFWVAQDLSVIGRACDIADTEAVNGCHDSSWEHFYEWPLLAKPASMRGREYDSIPRGRIVYHAGAHGYRIFCAPEVMASVDARRAIEAFFTLSSSVHRLQWNIDPHYVTQPDLFDEADSPE